MTISECKGKLYFSRQNNHRILRAEGLHQIRIAEVSDVCTKQTNRKPKCNKQSPNENGNARIPNTSQGLPRFSTGGASIEGCSQSAIEFSQRQMRDVEGLATKLTKDLKSMKVIMKEVLDPEVCPVTFSKQNMDEVYYYIKCWTLKSKLKCSFANCPGINCDSPVSYFVWFCRFIIFRSLHFFFF